MQPVGEYYYGKTGPAMVPSAVMIVIIMDKNHADKRYSDCIKHHTDLFVYS